MFSPTVTDGGGITTEFITAYSTTAPGFYPATACLTTYANGTYGSVCAEFYVEVVSTPTTAPTLPPNLPPQQVKLEASSAGVSSVTIPGQGHLYVELYAGGVPYTSLQGGPVPVVSGLNSGLKLEALKFTQYPLTQPSVDISQYVNASTLISDYSNYLAFQQMLDIPYYDPTGMNSNTVAAGLLLASGMSQSQITLAINQLQIASAFSFPGNTGDIYIEPCFESPSSRHLLGYPYGGCSGAPQLPPRRNPVLSRPKSTGLVGNQM